LRNIYIIILIPIIILAFLYLLQHKNNLNSNFKRVIISNKNLLAIDTINLKPGEIVDGLFSDNNNLWLNERFSLIRIKENLAQNVISVENKSPLKNPIVNFYVRNDTVYYYQANSSIIGVINVKGSLITYFKFDFPIVYFIRTSASAFLFQEMNTKNSSGQIHYVNYGNGINLINDTLFSNETGSAIKYSGYWFSSPENSNFFFVPIYEENILCFDSSGKAKYKLRSMDFQNQDLKIIKEGNRFSLGPNARVLRRGGSASKNYLFISSDVFSKSQSKSDFRNNQTIDVYKISNGDYLYSFYLPNFKDKKASGFVISKNKKLYVLYSRAIIIYNFVNFLPNE